MVNSSDYITLYDVYMKCSDAQHPILHRVGVQIDDESPCAQFTRAIEREDKLIVFDRYTLLFGKLTYQGPMVFRVDEIASVGEQKEYSQFINWDKPHQVIDDASREIYGT